MTSQQSAIKNKSPAEFGAKKIKLKNPEPLAKKNTTKQTTLFSSSSSKKVSNSRVRRTTRKRPTRPRLR